MLTPAQITNLVIANLNDDKLYGVQLMLTTMLERAKFDAVTPRYRFKIGAADITNLAELITALNTSLVQLKTSTAYYSAQAMSTIPVVVGFSDISVTLDTVYQSDNALTPVFGKGTKTLGFLMNYANDADTILPLKILNVVLI